MTKKIRRAKARRALLTLSLVLVVAFAAVGGTIAWLTAETEEIVNTFTVGDINITLTETDTENDEDNSELTNSYKMVPGDTIDKDPKVTVLPGSEASYLFVKVTESETLSDCIVYTLDGWTKLADDGDNNALTTVYWKSADAVAEDETEVTYPILTGNEVTVKDGVEIGDVAPTLKFQAAAVQSDNVDAPNVEGSIAFAQVKSLLGY